jgi:hypothetical protein
MPLRASLFRALLAALAVMSAASGCGPPKVRPVFYPDLEVPCPGGRTAWNLKILDRRAEREAHEQVVTEVREGVQKSFPGCRWSVSDEPGIPTITVEINRLASVFDGVSWEAAADWSISATDEEGRRLLEFESNEEVSRPNYQGSNNEKESLSEAYQRALERTGTGLRTVPTIGALRPLPETPSGGIAPRVSA